MGLLGPPNVSRMFIQGDVNGLIGAMADPDAQIRDQAMERLVMIGPPAINALIRALGDKREPVVRGAMGALKGIGIPAIGPLIDSLESENPRARAAASMTLISMKPLSTKPLVEAFLTNDWRTSKGEAIFSALKTVDESAIALLIDAVKRDNTDMDMFRLERIHTILMPYGPSVIPRLVGAFAGTGPDTHFRIACLLEKFGWKPGNDSAAIAYYEALNRYDDLAQIGAPAVPALVRVIERSKQRSWELFDQLRKIHSEYYLPGYDARVKPLEDARQYQLTQVFEPALKALKNIQDPAAAAPLTQYGLGSKEEVVRKAAEAAIAHLSSPPGIHDDPATFVRMGNWGKCLELGEKSIAPLLEELRYNYNRDMAADTLGRIAERHPGRAPEIARELILFLPHARGEDAARGRAQLPENQLYPIIRAMGRTGEPACVDALLPLICDGSQPPGIEKEAARALVRLYFRGRLDNVRKALIFYSQPRIIYSDDVKWGSLREKIEGLGIDIVDPGD